MYVVWVDLERKGRMRPVPCAEVLKHDLFGEGWVQLRGVEQIREAARPPMQVTDILMRCEDIRYVIGGIDPEDKANIMGMGSEAEEPTTEEKIDEKKEEAKEEKAHASDEASGSSQPTDTNKPQTTGRNWPTRYGKGNW